MDREAITSCRICAGMCSLRLERDATGRIVSARGDKSNPLTRGYACIKGLQLPAAHASPDRLLHPLKRLPDGRLVQMPLDEALDEIAERLLTLIGVHGPGSIAAFRGTMNYMEKAPTQEELLAILARNAGVPFDEMRASPQGKVFDVAAMTVQPGTSTARFEVAPPDVAAELAAVAAEPGTRRESQQGGFTHLLAVRRVRDVQNTMYRQLDAIRKRVPHNPAWLHPDDLTALVYSRSTPCRGSRHCPCALRRSARIPT